MFFPFTLVSSGFAHLQAAPEHQDLLVVSGLDK